MFIYQVNKFGMISLYHNSMHIYVDCDTLHISFSHLFQRFNFFFFFDKMKVMKFCKIKNTLSCFQLITNTDCKHIYTRQKFPSLCYKSTEPSRYSRKCQYDSVQAPYS